LFVLRDSCILFLRIREKSVAGREYARPNTGASITRASSGNGVLPTPQIKTGRKQQNKKLPRR